MRSPFQVARDWSAKHKWKKEMKYLISLPQYPVGSTVPIPLRGDPLMSVALRELVLENPKLLAVVQQPGGKMALLKRRTVDSLSKDLVMSLSAGGIILYADDLLRMNPEQLPGVVAPIHEAQDYERIPDDVPGGLKVR